jgi:hypothetical protein
MLRQQGTPPEPVPVPDQAATARYVRWDWNNQVEFVDPTTGEEQMVARAYVKGYNAPAAAFPRTIILGFGRQLEPGRTTEWGQEITEWSVFLPPDERPDVTNPLRVKNHAWVIAVAEAYIEGYSANLDHGYATVAIGTSNANVAWNCNYNGQTSTLWWQAGWQWSRLVHQIASPGDTVDLYSANDIESWALEAFTYDDGTPWYGCGAGAELWLEGYETAFPKDIIPVRNFGSDVRRELPEEWSAEETYNVLSGFVSTRAHPQIYCSQWVAPLAAFAAASAADPERGRIFFYGVTSENNGNANTCGRDAGSLTWQQSWLQFRDGLDAAGLPRTLARSVSSFCIPPVESEKRCTPDRYDTP